MYSGCLTSPSWSVNNELWTTNNELIVVECWSRFHPAFEEDIYKNSDEWDIALLNPNVLDSAVSFDLARNRNFYRSFALHHLPRWFTLRFAPDWHGRRRIRLVSRAYPFSQSSQIQAAGDSRKVGLYTLWAITYHYPKYIIYPYDSAYGLRRTRTSGRSIGACDSCKTTGIRWWLGGPTYLAMTLCFRDNKDLSVQYLHCISFAR